MDRCGKVDFYNTHQDIFLSLKWDKWDIFVSVACVYADDMFSSNKQID